MKIPIKDSIPAKVMCTLKTCSESGDRARCYTHLFVLCELFPDKPKDIIVSKKDVGLRKRK